MRRHTSAAAAELDWDGPSALPPSRLKAVGAEAVAAALGRDIDSPPARRPSTPELAVGASVAFVAPAGKPATQHVPVASIHTASTAVATLVTGEPAGEVEAISTAAQQIISTQGRGDGAAAPEQQRARSPDPPNPFAAVTAWDEAHVAARAPQPPIGAVTAARPLSTAASAATVPVSPIPASYRFSAANFSLPGRRATASVGEIRLAVAAAIAGQTAGGGGGGGSGNPAAAPSRNHSGSSSSNPSGTSSDGVQRSMGAAGGARFLRQQVAAASETRSAAFAGSSAPPGPRAGVAGSASSLRQAATAPVDICRMVRCLWNCVLLTQLAAVCGQTMCSASLP